MTELDNNHSDKTSQTPEGTTGENTGHDGGANFEQMFKDTQSAYTKSNTEKYKIGRMLVEANPRAILEIEDEKVVSKILQEKWNVDNIEELNMLYPKALKSQSKTDEDYDDDEESKYEKLEREMKLWRHKETKTKTEEAIALVLSQNELLVKSIPDIEDKIKNELKYISSELDASERVRRAVSIVGNGVSIEANAYNLLRGVTSQKTQGSSEKNDEAMKRQQDLLRQEVRKNNNI